MPSDAQPSTIRLYEDLPALVWAGAALFIAQAKAAVAKQGVFRVALSGGSTPLPMFALLALPEWRARLNWRQVHFYWADERTVPPDDPASNFGMARRALLAPNNVPEANIHRIYGETPPELAAADYAALLAGQPLDLVFLGLGDDGHTASLFPNTAALNEPSQLAIANHVPKLNQWRITLGYAALAQAQTIAFMVSGATKAEPLRQTLHGPYQPSQYPAQAVRAAGELLWLVDAEAYPAANR
jgi:6-phosphogluconolactonase